METTQNFPQYKYPNNLGSSFSKLKLVKSYERSSMAQGRLSS